LRYVQGVEPGIFYAVVGDQLLGLEQHHELPAEFLSLVPSRLETVLAEPALRIGGWTDPAEGPLVLALTAQGDLVSILAIPDTQLPRLGEMIESIDTWLSTLRLRELSELSGNHESFYEGLWNLSPDAPITLSTARRYVVLTASNEMLDEQPLFARLPNAEIDIRYHEVFLAPSGQSVIRRRSGQRFETVPLIASAPSIDEHEPLPIDVRQPGDHVADGGHIEVGPTELASPEAEPLIDLASKPDTDATDATDTIDLTYQTLSLPERPSFPDLPDSTVELRPGQTFLINELPALFDPLDDELQSVSDEIFTVRNNLVLVAKLPERRRATPFEGHDRFRWDTSLSHILLMEQSGRTSKGVRRSVLLFVETDRQPGIATFIGTLTRVAAESKTSADLDAAWFSISPSLEGELFRTLKKGRLPQAAANLISGTRPR
jgi:hypothetical protein